MAAPVQIEATIESSRSVQAPLSQLACVLHVTQLGWTARFQQKRHRQLGGLRLFPVKPLGGAIPRLWVDPTKARVDLRMRRPLRLRPGKDPRIDLRLGEFCLKLGRRAPRWSGAMERHLFPGDIIRVQGPLIRVSLPAGELGGMRTPPLALAIAARDIVLISTSARHRPILTRRTP